MSETDPPNEATEATITCRNCGSPDVQQWCPVCGQENIPSAMPIREILFGFLDELLKFDAKIWITLKKLITRPGLLTNEYLMGHRVRYVAPVKLYLAISFVTFFVLTLFPQNKTNTEENSGSFQNGLTLAQGILPMRSNNPSSDTDSEETKGLPESFKLDTHRKEGESDGDYKKRVEAAKKHADSCADVAKIIARSEAATREEVRRNTQRDAWISGNQTTLSLLSVPLYALLLGGLLRKDTKRLYVEHMIFALHYQCFEQLSTMASAVLRPMPLIGWLSYIVTLVAPRIYFVLAARSVYNVPLKRLLIILVGFLFLGFMVVWIKGFTAEVIYRLSG
ncbi:MAG: DUF3667 domain-containing protein [Armatimonas sp.]